MPLASCTYRLNGEQRSTLTCDGRSFIAFSGNADDVNSPTAIAHVDSGPLPTGRYYIDDETYIDGVRRGNFRLHPIGSGRISKGCITLVSATSFAQLSAYLRGGKVAYIPGTRIRCYGVVEVL
ncbi:tlde1 domain-containing protein [Trinickia acidisoli]|uniref:tlde1 domain-containing protein n=1 Tax=Trinickia acidisoli TaxID=2767482 RepID=UPI001A9050AB|nr:tlde1 domain-containing protein [Trinickia acidisoli]